MRALAFACLSGLSLSSSALGQALGWQQGLAMSLDAYCVEVADLDGDGFDDIIAVGYFEDQAFWVRQEAPGQFSAPQPIPVLCKKVVEIATGDLDADGDLDLVVASTGGPANAIAWVFNDGSGNFSGGSTRNASSDPTSLKVLDLDGDGRQDILIGGGFTGGVEWVQNTAAGTFGQLQQLFDVGVAGVRDLEAVDYDGDGDTDIVAAFSQTLRIYERTGSSTYASGQTLISGMGEVRDCAVGDFDNDGLLDYAIAHGDSVSWRSGVGGALVTLSTSVGVANSVLIADMDGDGYQDLVAGGHQSDILLFTAVGTGQPTESLVSGSVQGVQQLRSGSISGSCVPDVVSASSIDDKVAWHSNPLINACPLDCDQDGVSDYLQIQANGALDSDQNGILDSCEASGPYWIRSPITERLYTVQAPMPWQVARTPAQILRCYLTTVRTQEENDWLASVFYGTPFWLGIHDGAVEGQFQWHSGEPVAYTNWNGAPGNFTPDQDWGAMNPATGTWDTWFNSTSYRSVIESESVDCDANMVQDIQQIAADPSLDCNGNGLLDACELDDDPALDCNGNGVFDACEVTDPNADINDDGFVDDCTPPNYCTGGVNSTGGSGVMDIIGSVVLADDDFTLHAAGLPPFQWSFFLMSQGTNQVPGFGGSQGVLCLGPPIIRFDQSAGPGNQIDQTTGAGTRSYSVDFNDLPQSLTFLPGETWYFQLWFRDQNPALTSNTTDGIEVMFR